MDTDKINFKTSDLNLAAFLRSKRLKLINNENEGGKVYFIFESSSQISDLIQSYWNNGTVGVSDYVKALDDLKNIIFSIDRYRKGDKNERWCI